MKKVFLLCMMALALMASCHRPHVKHNHGVQMPRARVAKDSAQRNDIPKGTDNSWAEENLIVIPDMPEDAEVLNVWGFEAAYLDTYADQFPEGKYGWYITFATGDENGSGYPLVSFLLYTTKESAISGVYNVARANIDLESCYLNVDGQQENAILGTDAEVRLQFDGYDDEKAESGYRYGYYTGSFRIVGNNGTTYVAKFMELFCNSFNYSTISAVYRDHKGMWDEDPDYVLPFGIEEIRLDETTNGQKFLIDGQLIIVRDGKAFNALGTRVT